MAARSQVHALFWPKRLGTQHYRFCKLCFPSEGDVPKVDDVKQVMDAGFEPSKEWRGCVLNRHTPSNMVNHIRSKHPQHLPEHMQLVRACEDPDMRKKKIDLQLLRSWAEHMVLGALMPVNLIDDMHLRAVLDPRLPGLAHGGKLQEEVDCVVQGLRDEVARRVAEAKEQGCRFCISADGWKPRMKIRRSYVAVYLHWVDNTWTRNAVCAGVQETHPPRTGELYRDTFLTILDDLDLETKDLSCGMSDHEGAIRKGLRLLTSAGRSLPLVGCGCHAAQLLGWPYICNRLRVASRRD